nr:hypothetical protein [uncultured Prevotella sp.]
MKYSYYLCTVFKINTAPKILKKRELGKFMNLKSYNRSPVRRLEEEVEYLTLRIIENSGMATRKDGQIGLRLTSRKDGMAGWKDSHILGNV